MMAASPLVLLIASACVMGGLATLLVVVAISVDHWQEITFNEQQLREINSTSGTAIYSLSSDTQFYKVVQTVSGTGTANATTTEEVVHSSINGLWRTCDHISDTDRDRYKGLLNETLTNSHCFVFILDYQHIDEDSPLISTDAKQIAKLHNTAASCYIVVMIDLVSAVVVGLIGILQKQVASCMVTGVLYFMAVLFEVFGLAMFHMKQYYEKYDCASFDPLPDVLCSAHNVDLGYGIVLAWIGVVFCIFACILWLVFARALRVIMAKTML